MDFVRCGITNKDFFTLLMLSMSQQHGVYMEQWHPSIQTGYISFGVGMFLSNMQAKEHGGCDGRTTILSVIFLLNF